MKKLYTLLISICLVAVLFCQSGMVLTLSADEVDSVNSGKTVSLTQLVKLKKYLAKMPRSYDESFDYNEDKSNNAMDTVALRRLLLGLPVESEKVNETPAHDKDGFYLKVARP